MNISRAAATSMRLIAEFSFTKACSARTENVRANWGFPIKLQLLLIRAETYDKPLTAKCFIHDVMRSAFLHLVDWFYCFQVVNVYSVVVSLSIFIIVVCTIVATGYYGYIKTVKCQSFYKKIVVCLL